ncbi:hypothetical protein BDV06DRAFT_204158 [Aspergillus oleicola]
MQSFQGQSELEKITIVRQEITSFISRSQEKDRHSEIWGIDLQNGSQEAVNTIIQKFLNRHSTNLSLQLQRVNFSLQRTLEWRRRTKPQASLDKAKRTFSEMDILMITHQQDHSVAWVVIDERKIGSGAHSHHGLDTRFGIRELGLAALEIVAGFLMSHGKNGISGNDGLSSCVIEFKVFSPPADPRKPSRRREIIMDALQDLISLMDHHYPLIFDKTYIIPPCDEYMACLEIPDCMLNSTVILQRPEDLVLHLGPNIFTEYGGTGPTLRESDCLRQQLLEASSNNESPSAGETCRPKGTTSEKTDSPPMSGGKQEPVLNSTETEPEVRLLYSETIGPPTIVLDPEDLKTAENLCENKMGPRVVFADKDMICKFGDDVHLAEAEAMHLVSTRTTIPCPKLLSAYILDGIGYIIMSFEEGEPFRLYWNRASESQRDNAIQQLRDFVNQMRQIKGDYIGGLDSSPCRDGIFECGFGNFRDYSYGPYKTEADFNEGIIQALRDRLSKTTLQREKEDPESIFWSREHQLYQTVRELKGHEIVFTHADFHPRNMVVRSDGTVVILDWGLAGFWPEYWEFYRALFSHSWRASWDGMVEKFTGGYYIENSIMRMVFGTVWN